MDVMELAKQNTKRLRANIYPGRGMVIGMTPDGKHMVQVYWIMGRSTNSRNRVFEAENGFVRTKAYDETKVVDPSLIIYYPVKHYGSCHIISNGDQTDTIFEWVKNGGTFEKALSGREFEPDPPNYTPRISGIVNLADRENAYKLSILKTMNNNPDFCQRMHFHYATAIPGFGHCIHTYQGDGEPLPSFAGEPYLVSLADKIDDIAGFYWDLLNEENRVALLVKFIEIQSGVSSIKIMNKLT